MRIAWSIIIALVRQWVVWDIRARTGLYSAALTGFFLLWWIGHRSQLHGSRGTERGNSVPWHGSSMGLNTFGTIPALMWRMSVSPVMHLLHCFSFISSLSSLISLSRSHVPFWLKFWWGVSCFHGFECHLELAMAVSGQLIASSHTGHPYSSLVSSSVRSACFQVWFSS